MDATSFIINLSQNYPSLAQLIKFTAMLTGTGGIIWSLWMVYKVEVAGTVDRGKLSLLSLGGAFFISSLLVSFGWTMNFVGNSVFDYGGYILNAYEGTNEWRVRQGQDHLRVMKDFIINSCRLVGLFFGLWGLIVCLLAMKPDSQHSIWSGIIRLVVGAGFIDPITLLNFFGGLGDHYLK